MVAISSDSPGLRELLLHWPGFNGRVLGCEESLCDVISSHSARGLQDTAEALAFSTELWLHGASAAVSIRVYTCYFLIHIVCLRIIDIPRRILRADYKILQRLSPFPLSCGYTARRPAAVRRYVTSIYVYCMSYTYIYIYMYICIYIYIYICIYICIYVYIYIYRSIYTYMCLYVYMYAVDTATEVCISTYENTYIYINTPMSVYTQSHNIHKHAYIYLYTITHTNTYTHTRTCRACNTVS